jgi:energy-coupling factor transporter ATP-binding protein EcfA2
MNLLREVNARGTTVVVATHDRELIRRVGRRAIAIDHGRLIDTDERAGTEDPRAVRGDGAPIDDRAGRPEPTRGTY